MQKTYCDKCKKELEEKSRFDVSFYGISPLGRKDDADLMDTTLELCRPCAKDLEVLLAKFSKAVIPPIYS
jgi:hypothetical protein